MIAIFARKAYNKNNIVIEWDNTQGLWMYDDVDLEYDSAPQKTYGRPASGCRCHHTGTAG